MLKNNREMKERLGAAMVTVMVVCTLVMLGITLMPAAVSASSTSWTLDITTVAGGEDKGDPWVFGVNASATDDYEVSFDVLAPPAEPSGFDMYFYESSYATNYKKLKKDIKGTGNKTWTLIVAAPADMEVNFSWSTASIPSNVEAQIQESGETAQDMKTVSSIVFTGAVAIGTTKMYTITANETAAVLTTIEVAPSTATLNVSETQQFTATAKDQSGNPMTGIVFAWSSSNENVGTVNATGFFTAGGAGTTMVNATNGSVVGTAVVTVNLPAAEPAEWTVDITTFAGGEDKGDPWVFGVNASATDDYEVSFDVLAPPAEPSGFDMYFYESSYATNYKKLKKDIKGTGNKTWTLIVAAPADMEVNFSWSTASIPSNVEAQIQESGETAQDMKTVSSIVFTGAVAIGTTKMYTITANDTGVAAVVPPSITSYGPSATVSDTEGASRTFNVTVNQMVTVTWYINGTQVEVDSSTTEASYTNASAAVGVWNVTAVATNANGTDSQEWMWTVSAAVVPPSITAYSPTDTAITDVETASRAFSVTANQTVNVTWYINGTEVGSDTSVTTSGYTNTSAVAGVWNVTAVATNANGTDSQTWTWTVSTLSGNERAVQLVYNDNNIGYNFIAWTGSQTSASALATLINNSIPGALPEGCTVAQYNTTLGYFDGYIAVVNPQGGLYDFTIQQYDVVSVVVAKGGSFAMPAA